MGVVGFEVGVVVVDLGEVFLGDVGCCVCWCEFVYGWMCYGFGCI